jgi:hypothetical protein
MVAGSSVSITPYYISVAEHDPGHSVKGKEHNFNEEEPAEGCAFLWCLDCGTVDRVRYGNRTLPKYVKGEESESEFGMVLILCGTCRLSKLGNRSRLVPEPYRDCFMNRSPDLLLRKLRPL